MIAPPAAGPRVVHRVGTVASTQDAAFALAARGAADGTAVVADSQTAGRGRRGHRWHDEPGASLLVSVIVRTPLAAGTRPLLSYVAAVAVVETLRRAAGVEARVKWPNDVLVAGRKVAGILLEARDAVVVAGIGLNVSQRRFPPELAGRATSLALETGRAVDREAVLPVLLEELDRWRGILEREGFEPVRARWRAAADGLGRPVRVGDVSGIAVDLDGGGALVVDVDGVARRVIAGERSEEG
jgi:BirA family biotin operon repressor/biotin-[acetyl-CoA-carboxylase] ligase